MRSSLVLPNLISFSAALSACENANQWREALQLFVATRMSCGDAIAIGVLMGYGLKTERQVHVGPCFKCVFERCHGSF